MLALHVSPVWRPRLHFPSSILAFSRSYRDFADRGKSVVIALTQAGQGAYKAPPSTAGVAAEDDPAQPERSLTFA